eukprot:8362643-Prorocentrum_lima.AAC.1
MTSSLVGSEMCIRDSLLPYVAFSALLGMRLSACLLVSSRALGQTVQLSPVSYTHLTLPTICSV